ncbi:MAG: menaquinone biosynthesis protein [Nitrospirae bacterium]|nr:menaquinone biosynthesis protein [Nitrospirota bacterium]
MAKAQTRIGRIPYANLFPIFSMLEKTADCSSYEFIDGPPSVVNRLLREGEIETSPSSSIEYLRHGDLYTVLEGHSISSAGPVRSILLFSRKPIETLDGLTVLTSSQSETSVALLDIILRKFYELDCPLKSTADPFSRAIGTHTAYLLIGDDALKESLRWPQLHKYDLADIWYEKTGLPFVFALWIARRAWCIQEPLLFSNLKRDLDRAKSLAVKDFRSLAQGSSLLNILSEDELVAYWECISYDLQYEHRKGLDLFRRYAEELNLL